MNIDEKSFQRKDLFLINNLKLNGIQKIIRLAVEINVYNPIDDQNNGNKFKIWLKDFIRKTFEWSVW